jgi:hypothetical protein
MAPALGIELAFQRHALHQTIITPENIRQHQCSNDGAGLGAYLLDACSGGPIAMPDIGSTQTRWSRTPLTPRTFSAARISARRFLSSSSVPQSSTMPLCTMTSIRPSGAQLCCFNSVSRLSRIATSSAGVELISRARLASGPQDCCLGRDRNDIVRHDVGGLHHDPDPV